MNTDKLLAQILVAKKVEQLEKAAAIVELLGLEKEAGIGTFAGKIGKGISGGQAKLINAIARILPRTESGQPWGSAAESAAENLNEPLAKKLAILLETLGGAGAAGGIYSATRPKATALQQMLSQLGIG